MEVRCLLKQTLLKPVKYRLMDELREGPKTKAQLMAALDTSRSSVDWAIKKFIESEEVVKDGNLYSLKED